MLIATKDRVLPTTVTGSWPRPTWFTGNLFERPFSSGMADVAYREQFVDAVSSVLSDQELAEARTRLPAGTRHVVIPGANHSQFGFYGGHPFDGTPAISRASQIERTIDVLLAVLDRADRKPDPQGTLLRSSDVSFRQ